MKTFELPDKFAFTVEQVAELLDCDPQTIIKYIKQNKNPRKQLKATKPTGEWKILATDFREWLERNYYGAEPKAKI